MYRSDFNAEREARERIAGEKADLAEELLKYRKPTGTFLNSNEQKFKRVKEINTLSTLQYEYELTVKVNYVDTFYILSTD